MRKNKFTDEDVAFIYNLLRQGTVKWEGRAECLRLARKKVFMRRSIKGSPVYKYFWQCADCKKWHRNEAEMEVDHIVEIGGVGSWKGDWNEMISKIYPRPISDCLQALCLWCHQKKTRNYLSAQKQWTRKATKA
jgi:Zn-finger protein